MGNCVSLFLSFVYISFRLVSALSVFPTLVNVSNLNNSFKIHSLKSKVWARLLRFKGNIFKSNQISWQHCLHQWIETHRDETANNSCCSQTQKKTEKWDRPVSSSVMPNDVTNVKIFKVTNWMLFYSIPQQH